MKHGNSPQNARACAADRLASAQGSHPGPSPQHSVQHGSFSLATQETPSCCKAPKVSPGEGGRTSWKRSSGLCPQARAEALSALGATEALPALRCPGSEKPVVRPLLVITARQRNPPLGVCGARALSAGHHGNSCNVEDPGRSAEGPKVLWATKPVIYTGKGLSDRAWDTKKSFPSPFL